MTGTALVPVETLTPAIFTTKENADDIIAKLRAAAVAQVNGHDISTEEGRKAIASAAYAVARSKTAIDEMGKKLVADTKAKVRAFDVERGRIWDACEAIQIEVRKPLTDWEEADKARIRAHEGKLGELVTLGVFVADPTKPVTTAQITERVTKLLEIANSNYDWQEFRDRAATVAKTVKAHLDQTFSEAQAREDAAAEAARQAAARAEQERIEREQRIAAEAADRARVEAETAAQREIAEANARANAEAAARQLAEQQAAAAAETERKRLEAAKQREIDEAKRREASRLHREKVKGDAAEAIYAAVGLMTLEMADAVFDAIADGKIPNVKVEW